MIKKVACKFNFCVKCIYMYMYTCTYIYMYICNSCKTLIGVHEMHGRMHSN